MVTRDSYATPLELAESLQLAKDISYRQSGEDELAEFVGTGDNSASIFYLANRNVFNGTLVLSHGLSKSSDTPLTETTDYTVDLDRGRITLTAAGITAVGTDNIYALYTYCAVELSDTHLQDTLNRAKNRVDNSIGSTFTDGTSANPSYPWGVEVIDGRGYFSTDYFVGEIPLIDVSSALSGSITSSDTSLDVAAGDGLKFPTTGYIVIGTEVIQYTGVSTDTLTGLTRGALGSIAALHLAGDDVHTTILRTSNTPPGTAPTWEVQAWESDFFAEKGGKIQIYRSGLDTTANVVDAVPLPSNVANRVEVRHYYGYDEIPYDIKRLNILFAREMLRNDSFSRAIITGRDEFNPQIFQTDASERTSIIKSYQLMAIGRT